MVIALPGPFNSPPPFLGIKLGKNGNGEGSLSAALTVAQQG